MNNELEQYKKFSENFVPDCIYPSDNDFEIPVLLETMNATTVDVPFVCFGEQRRTMQMNGLGTLHFYTEDYRFCGIWDYPEKILRHNPRNIIEPNFSIYDTTPVALGLSAIYKKRQLSRAMQDKGIRVFVDLNVASKFQSLNLLGVPNGWSSFATRGYSDRLAQLETEYELAKSVAGDNRLTFVVYGGGQVCRDFCKDVRAIYITPIVAIKNKLRRAAKLADVVIEPQQIKFGEYFDKIYSHQIENFSE